MANEIVKYRNRLNQIPLRKFNTREMNLFFTIASRFTEKGTKEITFSFSSLKKLSNYSDFGERFIDDLQKTYNKMLNINAYTDDGDTITRFVAFNKYQIKRSRHIVTISVNPEFKGLFNDLINSFTRFSLEEFTRLKSTYAKTMFRIIKQFRTTGYLEFKITDFRNLLDIPKSYKTNDINKRVLKPVKIELSPIFRSFAYKKLKQKSQGNKIIGYKFTWQPEAKDKNDFQDTWQHYREQIENIKTNEFLEPKEKQASQKLIKNHFFKKVKTSRSTILIKGNLEKKDLRKKVKSTSNDKAKQALADYKRQDKD